MLPCVIFRNCSKTLRPLLWFNTEKSLCISICPSFILLIVQLWFLGGTERLGNSFNDLNYIQCSDDVHGFPISDVSRSAICLNWDPGHVRRNKESPVKLK